MNLGRHILFIITAKDCTWSEWVVWSPCSVTCGTGTKSRYRAKLGPTDGGKDCEGTTTMEKVQCTGALAKCVSFVIIADETQAHKATIHALHFVLLVDKNA